MSLFEDALRGCLEGAGIVYGERQIALSEEYYKLVVKKNKYLNLTRITGEREAAIQHFAEGMMLLKYYAPPEGARLIDIGSGAGFPGIPIKIMRPDIDMTLLDSAGKKTEFIKTAAESIGIDVNVIPERAEEVGRGALRESFDAALSRAVAPLNMLIELCVPFVKTGGVFAAWKGESYKAEIGEAQGAFNALGCAVTESHVIGEGAIMLIEKLKSTPDKYPRRFAKMKSQPL
jgi:16S rRNA (guanine527-N7)-methyltransferase